MNKHGVSSLRRYRSLISTIGLGVIASLLLFKVVNNWEEENLRIEFESRSMGYANAVQNDLSSNIEALRAVGDFFNNSEEVTREEFSGFVNNALSRHPSIQAFSWNPLVQLNERAAYELLAQKKGFENFQFTERSEEKKLVRAGQRQEYVVVYYIDPLEANRPALGFDIASDPTRLQAIHRGFKTGRLSVTDRVTLVQETGKQAVTLLLLPIYLNNTHPETQEERHRYRKGFVVEVLRIGDLVKNALKDFPDQGIDLYLYDTSAPKEEDRFLHFQPTKMSPNPQFLAKKEVIQGLYWSKNFDVAGRQWEIVFRPTASYLASHKSWQAWGVLSASLFITFLLTFYLFKKLNYAADIEKRVHEQILTNLQLEKEVIEREQAEKALAKSEERFRLLYENAPLPYQSLDFNGNILEVNETWLETLGYTKKEVIGKSFGDFLPGEMKEHFEDKFSQFKDKGEILGVEFEMVKKEGSCIITRFNCKIGRDAEGNFKQVHCIFHDITEELRTKKEKEMLLTQLQQAQKMEAIGTLAGGIAHDFNNILSIIIGYADMVVNDAPPEAKYAKDLGKVLESGHRAKDLVKQILAFSRQTEIERIPIQIQSLTKEVLRMLRSSIPTTIEIHDDIDSRCGVVLADPTQVHQILMNLCTNANHAMEESGGILEIKLKNVCVDLDSRQAALNLEPGDYVELIVSDTGLGIGPDVIERIFDPYFTTKELGKGTGMGLSITHGIITGYGGTITVESELGKGTTFHVYFPVFEQDEVALVKEVEKIPRGHGRILFIDDEELLTEMGKDMLELLGYSVTVRQSSLEALTTFQNDPDAFDVIITDQTMPGMTGSDLARRILQIRPGIPIILCTGYSNLIDKETAQSLGIKEFAMKPLTRVTIAKLLRKVLHIS